MANILIFGAGRSSSYFIKKVQEYCGKHQHWLTLMDASLKQLPKELKGHEFTKYVVASVFDKEQISIQIQHNNIVVSMLPPQLHLNIAKVCLRYKKHLLTASYVSNEMKFLDEAVKKEGLLFLNELGVDPGLDHISALVLLDKIKDLGGIIKSFKSHTGGIVAKKTSDNLWDYRITWNPKNVIRAGCDGAIFLKNGMVKEIDYMEVFSEAEKISIDEQCYDSYPNRDSLKYIEKYNLKGIESCYRGTLRHNGFCEAWDIFIQLGITKNSQELQFSENATREQFLGSFLKKKKGQCTKEAFLGQLKISEENPIVKKFNQLGFLGGNIPLKLLKGTPAEILQSILEVSWKIKKTENDMLLMHHQVGFELSGKMHQATSTLKVIGENQKFTAMAKTVGVPLFEALCLMIENKIDLLGVQIPTHEELYTKLYEKMKGHDLFFEEIIFN